MKNYDIEVKECFGNTDAYREYEKKTANYDKEKWQGVNDGLMIVFAKFANCKQNGCAAASNEAQLLVKQLQDYITENYYTCTREILVGLSQMYVFDDRFKDNIDKCAPGTAEFVREVIEIYCAKVKS